MGNNTNVPFRSVAQRLLTAPGNGSSILAAWREIVCLLCSSAHRLKRDKKVEHRSTLRSVAKGRASIIPKGVEKRTKVMVGAIDRERARAKRQQFNPFQCLRLRTNTLHTQLHQLCSMRQNNGKLLSHSVSLALSLSLPLPLPGTKCPAMMLMALDGIFFAQRGFTPTANRKGKTASRQRFQSMQ